MTYPTATLAASDYPTALAAAIAAINARLKGNLLINGAFQIWQKGTSIAGAAAAATGTVDGWNFCRSGFAAGATISRQTGSNARYCARLQRDNSNSSTATIYFAQSIETADSIPYRSKAISLKFRARKGANYSATSDALQYFLQTGTGTDESVNASLTGATNIASGTVTLTTSWQTFEIAAATPGASITQIGVRFAFDPVGTAGAADYVEIEQVQLVADSYAGDFPYKSDAEELALCQRRFSKSFILATAPAQNVGGGTGEMIFPATKATTGTNYSPRVPFPVRMRATPSVTIYNPSATNGQVRDATASGDCSSTAANIGSESGFYVSCAGNGSGAVGNALAFHWAASAEL